MLMFSMPAERVGELTQLVLDDTLNNDIAGVRFTLTRDPDDASLVNVGVHRSQDHADNMLLAAFIASILKPELLEENYEDPADMASAGGVTVYQTDKE